MLGLNNFSDRSKIFTMFKLNTGNICQLSGGSSWLFSPKPREENYCFGNPAGGSVKDGPARTADPDGRFYLYFISHAVVVHFLF